VRFCWERGIKNSILLTSEYKDLLDRYEAYQAELFRGKEPEGLYEPVRYLLGQSGKKLRPLLSLMTARGISGGYEAALPVAAAVEVFHNFTLMHDDIMDEAPMRRGQSTVHVKYDTSQAILSGDVMLIWSYRLLGSLGIESGERCYMMDRFSEVATLICEGQQGDMLFEGAEAVSLAAYFDMIEKKTAVLLGAAIELGALSVSYDRDKAKALYNFGRKLGLSFQMQDDWLDVFGDSGKTGKLAGGDIIRKKKTCLYVIAMDRADRGDRDLLKGYYSPDSKVGDGMTEEVSNIFRKYEVDTYVVELVHHTKEEALEHLKRSEVPDRLKSELENLSNQLVDRTY
jgi:geranylgeranyl diphosphate synthase, type II